MRQDINQIGVILPENAEKQMIGTKTFAFRVRLFIQMQMMDATLTKKQIQMLTIFKLLVTNVTKLNSANTSLY